MADIINLPIGRTRTVDEALAAAKRADLPHCIVVAEMADPEGIMALIFSEMSTAEAVYLLEKAKMTLLSGERTADL